MVTKVLTIDVYGDCGGDRDGEVVVAALTRQYLVQVRPGEGWQQQGVGHHATPLLLPPSPCV